MYPWQEGTKLKLQTSSGKTLTQANWEDTDIGFSPWNGGLIIIGTNIYPLEDAEKLVKKLQAAIDEAKTMAGEG